MNWDVISRAISVKSKCLTSNCALANLHKTTEGKMSLDCHRILSWESKITTGIWTLTKTVIIVSHWLFIAFKLIFPTKLSPIGIISQVLKSLEWIYFQDNSQKWPDSQWMFYSLMYLWQNITLLYCIDYIMQEIVTTNSLVTYMCIRGWDINQNSTSFSLIEILRNPVLCDMQRCSF